MRPIFVFLLNLWSPFVNCTSSRSTNRHLHCWKVETKLFLFVSRNVNIRKWFISQDMSHEPWKRSAVYCVSLVPNASIRVLGHPASLHLSPHDPDQSLKNETHSPRHLGSCVFIVSACSSTEVSYDRKAIVEKAVCVFKNVVLHQTKHARWLSVHTHGRL